MRKEYPVMVPAPCGKGGRAIFAEIPIDGTFTRYEIEAREEFGAVYEPCPGGICNIQWAKFEGFKTHGKMYEIWFNNESDRTRWARFTVWYTLPE